MTKLQALKSSCTKDIRDSWVLLGSNIITLNTKAFLKDQIYKIDNNFGHLQNCIVFCNEECFGNIPWEQADIIDYGAGLITFGNNIISPNFTLLLTADEVEDLEDQEVDYNLIPFKQKTVGDNKVDVDPAGTVVINDKDYELCIRCLGYPFITEDELEYSRDQIIDLAIRPALEEYFKWFPRVEVTTYPVGMTSLEYPFPTNAYGIVRYDIQQAGANGAGAITNSLLRYWDEALYRGWGGSQITGTYYGQRSPRYNGSVGAGQFLSTRAASQGMINYSTRIHLDEFNKEDGSRWIRIYSTKGGTAEVYWAVKTLNFNDVEFARRPELIDLCEAHTKKLFGNLRRQSKTDIPGAVDYSSWISEADETINRVREDWKTLVKASTLMRGGL